MQDVTDHAFMRLISQKGAPDFFMTEYFRVYAGSRPEAHILECIERNETGRPIIAQLLGHDIENLVATIRALETRPIAGIDLNLGCPAPKVYRKNVGGGLLSDLGRIKEILTALRENYTGHLSIKTRVGFENADDFERLLDIVEASGIDMFTLHARSVRALYRGAVDYEKIARAATRLTNIRVVANGDITSAAKAAWVRAHTNCTGVMIGRSALRNPWIFRQIRELSEGSRVFEPTLADVHAYVHEIWEQLSNARHPESVRLGRVKKFLNFVGQSIDAHGNFLKAMRTTKNARELFDVCEAHLGGANAPLPFATEPFAGVIARPNCE